MGRSSSGAKPNWKTSTYRNRDGGVSDTNVGFECLAAGGEMRTSLPRKGWNVAELFEWR